MSDPKSPRRSEMSKTERANCVTVLEALKAHNCIGGYTIAGSKLIPEWAGGGVERVVRELKSNAEPFGIKRNQRGWLLLLLPQNEQQRFGESFMQAFKEPL